MRGLGRRESTFQFASQGSRARKRARATLAFMARRPLRHYGDYQYRSASVVLVLARLMKNQRPTAVQDLGEEQETASSWLIVVPAGFGVGWIDQLVPLQRSASVVTSVCARLAKNPTAVQYLRDAHDTSSRPLFVALAGLEVGWIDQPMPFHRSDNVTSVLARLMKNHSPTAMQDLGEEQETASSWLLVAPTRLGVGWIDQLVPFQRSANVSSRPVRLVKNPTAVQDLGDAHETPRKLLLVAPAGFGVDGIDQLVPFECSTNVSSRPVRLVKNPTAVQDLGDAHDTPSSALYAPARFGVCWTVQLAAAAAVAIATHSTGVTHPTTAQRAIRACSATPRPPRLLHPRKPARTTAPRRRLPGDVTTPAASSSTARPPSLSKTITIAEIIAAGDHEVRLVDARDRGASFAGRPLSVNHGQSAKRMHSTESICRNHRRWTSPNAKPRRAGARQREGRPRTAPQRCIGVARIVHASLRALLSATSGAETAARWKSSLSPIGPVPPLAATPFGGKHETESGRLESAGETAALPL